MENSCPIWLYGEEEIHMKTPDTVVMFKSKYIKDREEMEYCSYINDLIRRITTKKGKPSVSPDFYGISYVYQNDKIRCTFNDSDYGNDHYHFEVNAFFWNDIPAGVNPDIVCDEGYNLVYSFQDSPDRSVLRWHIPGDWVEILKKA